MLTNLEFKFLTILKNQVNQTKYNHKNTEK